MHNITKLLVATSLTAIAVPGITQETEPNDVPPSTTPPPTIDTDGDGAADAWDRDGDGSPDVWDTDGDGKPDAVDNDGDGKPDPN